MMIDAIFALVFALMIFSSYSYARQRGVRTRRYVRSF